MPHRRAVEKVLAVPDPFDFLYRADIALAEGDRETAAVLVEAAYDAFDFAEANRTDISRRRRTATAV